MTDRRKYATVRGLVSLLLLFGYFLNVISFESFHQVVHNHDHSELHSQEAEADACHRAIFHGEQSHECEHKSHFLETEAECQLCDVVVSRPHYSSETVCISESYKQYTVNTPASVRFFGYNFSLAFAPRGPPTFS